EGFADAAFPDAEREMGGGHGSRPENGGAFGEERVMFQGGADPEEALVLRARPEDHRVRGTGGERREAERLARPLPLDVDRLVAVHQNGPRGRVQVGAAHRGADFGGGFATRRYLYLTHAGKR